MSKNDWYNDSYKYCTLTTVHSQLVLYYPLSLSLTHTCVCVRTHKHPLAHAYVYAHYLSHTHTLTLPQCIFQSTK